MANPSKAICVYCGSRNGAHPAYLEQAQAFGEIIARKGWRLVYGAGDIGMMGAVARSAQAAGADTFGVIPTHLLQREMGKRDLSRFVITENMHERKKVMFMNSDAIVVLPGGAGSLDEFFEILTWRQLGLHGKPIFLLNTEDYWSPLIALVDHVIAQGFAESSLRDFFTAVPSAEKLEDALGRALA